MWFDEIMDDCKQALITCNKYKSVMVPIFIKLALTFVIGAYVFISFIAGIIKHEYILQYMFDDSSAFMEVLPTILINGAVIYLLALIGFTLLDVGSINLFKVALSDNKPRYKDFTEGIKNYFVKVLLGKLFIHVLLVLTSPVLLALYLLYALLVGTLTAGWGILFLGVFIAVYLGTWISIVVIEGDAPFTAIGKSIRLGRRYFKGLFVVLLASTLISTYSVALIGPFAAVVGGWFIAGLVATYFNMVVMLIYYRNRESL